MIEFMLTSFNLNMDPREFISRLNFLSKLPWRNLAQRLAQEIPLICWVLPGILFGMLFLSALLFSLGKSFLEFPVLREIALWFLSDPFMARANLAFRSNDLLLMSMFFLGFSGWLIQGLSSFWSRFRSQSRAGFCLGLAGFFCLSYIYGFRELIWEPLDPIPKLGFLCFPFAALGLMTLSYLLLPWEARLRQDFISNLEKIRLESRESLERSHQLLSSARLQGVENQDFYSELESIQSRLRELDSSQEKLLELDLRSKLDPRSGIAASQRMLAELEHLKARLSQLESGMGSILDSETSRVIEEISKLLSQFPDTRARDLLLRYYCSDSSWRLLRRLGLVEQSRD